LSAPPREYPAERLKEVIGDLGVDVVKKYGEGE